MLLFFTPKKSMEFSTQQKNRPCRRRNHPKKRRGYANRDAKDIASRWIEDVAGGIGGIPLPIGPAGHKLEEGSMLTTKHVMDPVNKNHGI